MCVRVVYLSFEETLDLGGWSAGFQLEVRFGDEGFSFKVEGRAGSGVGMTDRFGVRW